MDKELFHSGKEIDYKDMPLAERVRPQTLDEFVGQHKILEKDTILRNIKFWKRTRSSEISSRTMS
jgi:putative ATPase